MKAARSTSIRFTLPLALLIASQASAQTNLGSYTIRPRDYIDKFNVSEIDGFLSTRDSPAHKSDCVFQLLQVGNDGVNAFWQIKINGTPLHENGLGDKLISTRFAPNDHYTHFILHELPDKNTFRFQSRATGRFWNWKIDGKDFVTSVDSTNSYKQIFVLEPPSAPKGRNWGTLKFRFDVNKSNEDEMYSFIDPGFRITAPNESEPVYILIHGFQGDENSLSKVRAALLDKGKNVLTVDWSSMAGNYKIDYSWVYSRMWFVGWRLSDLIEELGLNPERTEIIGSSLGAHIAGIAGHRYHSETGKKFNRIIGLDAAGYLMETLGPEYRLSLGDADQVIGIHSSNISHTWNDAGNALGWYSAYGDLDIYIYTYHDPDAGNTGQLLGSGSGWHRHQHDYAEKLYVSLVKGYSFKYADKWTWDENDFSGEFSLSSLTDNSGGNVTVWHTLDP